MLAAGKSEWSLPSVEFISVYMKAINDDLTLGTNGIIWHINNKFMKSKKPRSKRGESFTEPFIELSYEVLGEVNLNHRLVLFFSVPGQTRQWMKADMQ